MPPACNGGSIPSPFLFVGRAGPPLTIITLFFLISQEVIEVANNLVIRTACVALNMLEEPTNKHKLFVTGFTSEYTPPCIINARSVTAVDIVTELSVDVTDILADAGLKVD
jgi:hypothetical protein